MGQQTDAMTMRTMLSPLLALSLSLTLFSLAGAECPPLEDIPLSIDNTTFTCARIYQGAGDDDVIQVLAPPTVVLYLGATYYVLLYAYHITLKLVLIGYSVIFLGYFLLFSGNHT